MTNSSSLINIIYLCKVYYTYYDSKNYNIKQTNTIDSWLSSVEYLFAAARRPPGWNKSECRYISHQLNDNSSSLINIIYLCKVYYTYYDSKNYNIKQTNTIDSWLSSVEFLFAAARRPPGWNKSECRYISHQLNDNSSSLINIIYLYKVCYTYYDSKNYNIIQTNTIDSWLLSVVYLFAAARRPPCWNTAECRHIFHQLNEKFFVGGQSMIQLNVLYL
jgi:hypothetical protein